MSPRDKNPDRMIGMRKLTDAEITLYLLRRFDDPFGVGENLICWIAENGLNKMSKQYARELLVNDMTEH